MLEGVSTGDIVHEESTGGPAVVGSSDGAEGFLAGGIPNLEFDLFVINVDHASAEFDADG